MPFCLQTNRTCALSSTSWKRAPPADVVTSIMIEIRVFRIEHPHQFDQPRPPLDPQSTASLVDVSPNDVRGPLLSVRPRWQPLILNRVALIVGGHANILCRAEALSGLLPVAYAADDKRIDHGSNWLRHHFHNTKPLTSMQS